jgi:4-amino-4-deoxy-L-arabinose transferase-like glycosyltransferase
LLAHRGLWLALCLGLMLKVTLLVTRSVTFNGDEAVLALMARHILQGERPIFFYGQSYMGALDAYLIALSFLIWGQSVLAVRLVQIVLYTGVLVTTYALAYRLNQDRFAATAAALLIAIPTVLFSTYTTATLGDYVETLLLGNLILLIVWGILSGERYSGGWWLVAGWLAGLGWWSMSLIVTAVAPLALLGMWHFRRKMPWGRVGLLMLGFMAGALPWLMAVLSDPAAILAEVSGLRLNAALSEYASAGPFIRMLSLVAFNIPSLFGLRPPWSLEWIALPVGVPVAMFYLFVLWRAVQRVLSGVEAGSPRLPLTSLLGGFAVLGGLMLATPFGSDPTGRYLLPLYPLLAILVGDWLGRARQGLEIGQERWTKIGAVALLLVCLSYNLWGNVRSMLHNPPGLTTQFNLITHIPHDYDDDLIAFLDSIGADRGYSNYWVAYRFAFLTQERIIFSPRLPYKDDLSYTRRDDRYPLYTQVVEASERVVYVTSNLPVLDAELRRCFERVGVTFREQRIGPYTVFYDLSRPVTPEELGLAGEVTD